MYNPNLTPFLPLLIKNCQVKNISISKPSILFLLHYIYQAKKITGISYFLCAQIQKFKKETSRSK